MYSIVIPTLNEAQEIKGCLDKLQDLGKAGVEIIVVDGGSTDETEKIGKGLCDQLVLSNKGRALQMNAGAEAASGEFIFFLHVDTVLPDNFLDIIQSIPLTENSWGRFDITLSGSHRAFRLIEFMINLRSRLSGIATGDQVIFVSKTLFQKVGGYPEIPLMEDISLSRALKKISSPLCLKDKVQTSSRRWEQHGIFSTILKMWWLRFIYFCGADPVYLAKQYG